MKESIDIIYLEPDEEITSVIDKLKASESNAISLVIPRGATLAQSIVNLKLLRKSAEGFDKNISLISSDRIARNLSSQLGIAVYSKVSEAQNAKPIEKPIEIEQEKENDEFKINNYSMNDDESEKVEDLAPTNDGDEETDFDEEEDNTEDDNYKHAIREALKDSPEEEDEPEFKRETIEPREPKEENTKKDDGEKKDMKKSTFSRKPLIITASIVFVLLLAASYLLLPYANARVIVKTEDYKFEDNIIVSKDVAEISVKDLQIPGQLVRIEKEFTKEFDSTGTKDAGEKAIGKIVAYNDYDDKPLLLQKGTKFSANDKIYISTEDATVPGFTFTILPGPRLVTNPGSVEISVEADKAGDQYNIGPSDFSILTIPSEKQDKIYGKSTTAFTGGVTKEIKIVTESDLTNAEKSLIEELNKSMKAELIESADSQKISVIEDAIAGDIISSTSDSEINNEKDKFNYTLKYSISTIGFIQSDLYDVVRKAVESKLEDKMLIDPEKSEITYKFKEAGSDSKIILAIGLNGKIASKLTEDNLKRGILNKSISEASSILKENEVVSDVAIDPWPNFIKRMPLMAKRINIDFDYEK